MRPASPLIRAFTRVISTIRCELCRIAATGDEREKNSVAPEPVLKSSLFRHPLEHHTPALMPVGPLALQNSP